MTRPASSPLKQIVAANIDRLIKQRGLTNRQVGDAVGATEHQVWRWRKGKTGPSDANRVALADALSVSVADLYADHDVKAAA